MLYAEVSEASFLTRVACLLGVLAPCILSFACLLLPDPAAIVAVVAIDIAAAAAGGDGGCKSGLGCGGGRRADFFRGGGRADVFGGGSVGDQERFCNGGRLLNELRGGNGICIPADNVVTISITSGDVII